MLNSFVNVMSILAHLAILIASPSQKMERQSTMQLQSYQFPAGTVFILQDAERNRIYFATPTFLQHTQTKARFDFSSHSTLPESLVFSANRKSLIVRTSDDSYVLQADTLQLIHRFSNSYAWWEGSRLGYIDHYHGYIFSHGQMLYLSQRQTEIIAANSTGKYFIRTRKLNKGGVKNGNTPTYSLQLCRKMNKKTWQVVKLLATVTYDPGSEGNPRRLAVLNKGVAIFGLPNGGADNEDFIGVIRGNSIKSPLKDSRGKPLQFVQSPIVTKNSIVGIAEAIDSPHVLTGDRYFYQITEKSIVLKHLTKDVVFVTNDAKRNRIGFGVESQNRVFIRYPKLIPTQKWSRQERSR